MENGYLENLAADMVARARKAGATGAEVLVREAEEFSTCVRLQKIESLKEASSKGLGLRLLMGARSATSYTSDFSTASLERLLERTVAMARVTSEDPAGVLPEPQLMAREFPELELYAPDTEEVSTSEKIALARRGEEAALAVDPRIKNSEGAWLEANVVKKVLANSLGFVGGYRASLCTLAVTPVAEQGEEKQRDYWYSVARSFKHLEPPEQVGRKAAERALRRLRARKVPTCQVPVVFDPETARSLVGHLFEATRGDAIYRSASFLTGKLGEHVAAPCLTVVDDGLRRGGLGSRPFDDEGVPSELTPVIENGRLASFLLNCYTARKLNLKTTANAARGLAGPPGVGPKNLYLLPGTKSPEEIIRSVSRGFYVTELIGFGVNVVTGDYSRGAAGLWIEDGELTYPVEEVTVAGNLSEMLRHVEELGNDLEFRSALAAPTLLVTGLTVAGT